ncbi:hypothetical protein OUZ56_004960 [Daphnia magna]|uniref:Uncharacterized protein n=1 Tax=Daphnia magna TaxID=35525 RepID=A0ABQ9YRD1_9CRUS|nr:hypothetical protein OUZ56_004960 [Daphnia magna]
MDETIYDPRSRFSAMYHDYRRIVLSSRNLLHGNCDEADNFHRRQANNCCIRKTKNKMKD